MLSRTLPLLCLLCLTPACNSDPPDTSPGADASTMDAAPDPDEPAALAGITALHNQVRATVDVPPLTWDPELAQIAQSWADQCIDQEQPTGLIDHNPGRNDAYPDYVGENIYGTSQAATPQDAVSSWASEAQYYDHDSNTCASALGCGHYTQIVWRTTTKLGCGISSCPGLAFGNAIVCNYAPGGNIGGQRPY